ncbi:MAG: sigma 54-interacting transcriptional regulator [Deltaproteobacteria bacterium]|nr:sigma 54-interacting transcriptional regulator [Deltaproteobacteria bacterium]
MTTSTLTDSDRPEAPPGATTPGLTLLYSQGLARAGEQVALGRRAALLLGRDEPLFPGGALRDPRMSGRHAALAAASGGWTLVDRGSKNGTFVNGKRVVEHALAPGDLLRVGSTFLVFAPVSTGPARPHDSDGLVGVSAAMAAVRDSAALVASTDQTVLLLGESGSGKEVLAAEVHRRSGRPGPFLAVNCASLRGELLESELFGHIRGAFTGAQRAHDGLFLRAAQGTVFLDEVGELDEAAQARLLRVLEARTVRPVGASVEVPIDARVIAATNREVAELVRQKRLRADLYARLARWTITLPPLRERREDLGVLVRALLARRAPGRTQAVAPASTLDAPPGLDLSAELMAALCEHPWPLNVRGLVNVIEAARIAQPGVTRLELVPHVVSALAAQADLAPDVAPAVPSEAPPRGPDELVPVLERHRGNVAAAARELGLTRQSLYRLIERLGIDPERYRG